LYIGKTEELESTVREKETQLVHQEAEAREAITKWEERCEAISTDISACKEDRDEVERSFLKLEAQLSVYHVSMEELHQTLQDERSKKDLMSKQMEEAELAYKKHIEEIENVIQEHVEATTNLEAQLDERDEALVQAGNEIELLNKELLENTKVSEEVVSKWQGKSLLFSFPPYKLNHNSYLAH
jgi:chromosome segregation ATPase